MNSSAGQVVSRAIEIDSDIDCHIPPDLDRIPARVYAAVKTLRQEKIRYQNEQQDNARNGQPAIHDRRRR
jgi:hypothetical protein